MKYFMPTPEVSKQFGLLMGAPKRHMVKAFHQGHPLDLSGCDEHLSSLPEGTFLFHMGRCFCCAHGRVLEVPEHQVPRELKAWLLVLE